MEVVDLENQSSKSVSRVNSINYNHFRNDVLSVQKKSLDYEKDFHTIRNQLLSDFNIEPNEKSFLTKSGFLSRNDKI